MNYNLIYLIICLASAAITFTRFEPIQDQLKKLTLLKGKFWHQTYKLLSCPTCVGFWLGLIYTQNLFTACITSVTSTYIAYQTNRL